jgi:hypothetical protein
MILMLPNLVPIYLFFPSNTSPFIDERQMLAQVLLISLPINNCT